MCFYKNIWCIGKWLQVSKMMPSIQMRSCLDNHWCLRSDRETERDFPVVPYFTFQVTEMIGYTIKEFQLGYPVRGWVWVGKIWLHRPTSSLYRQCSLAGKRWSVNVEKLRYTRTNNCKLGCLLSVVSSRGCRTSCCSLTREELSARSAIARRHSAALNTAEGLQYQ